MTVAKAGDDEVAFGFLCGRDYGTKTYVAKPHHIPSLKKIRAQAEAEALAAVMPHSNGIPASDARTPSIGLPSALSLAGEVDMWQIFFSALGIKTITSRTDGQAVAAGKQRMGAEFCAPIAALHGHALSLLDSADYIFLPRYLGKEPDLEEGKHQYCYCTQFASALVSQLADSGRFLMPLVEVGYTSFHAKSELHRCLSEGGKFKVSHQDVSDAWELAQYFRAIKEDLLKAAYQSPSAPTGSKPRDIGIVLLGRPYSVLMPDMNKEIGRASCRERVYI